MRIGSLLLSIAVVGLGGCFEDTPGNNEGTGDTSSCEQGLLGCSCFPNGTCSADYVCNAGECQPPSDATASSSDAGTTVADSTGSTGTTGGDSGTTAAVDGTSTGQESSTGAEPAHVLFTTSTRHTGLEVGGLTGADQICRDLGQGVRAGAWVAVLRDAITTFEGRIEINGPVVNTVGEVLAEDEASLLTGPLQSIPGYDESGTPVSAQDLVWTGSMLDDCIGWTVDDPAFSGTVGLPTSQDRWLDTEVPLPCSGSPRLYCVSQ